MNKFPRIAVASLIALAFQGCSSSTTVTPPPPTPPSVNYTQNAAYTYNQDKMDTATTTVPEHRDSTNRDVVTSTVLTTNLSGGYAGKTGVVQIENVHSLGGTRDTTYIYQESGKVYRYNYGLEALSATIVATIGKPLNPGWVLEADLSATAGTSWTALDTTVYVLYGGANIQLHIVDHAVESADTNVVVGEKGMVAKHSVHTVTATMVALNTVIATISLDNYTTVHAGTVLNITHWFELTVPGLLPGTGIAGQYTVMTSMK